MTYLSYKKSEGLLNKFKVRVNFMIGLNCNDLNDDNEVHILRAEHFSIPYSNKTLIIEIESFSHSLPYSFFGIPTGHSLVAQGVFTLQLILQ
jgi:hypothetical protein